MFKLPPAGSQWTEYVEVTPDTAKQMFALNIEHNREISYSAVGIMAADMKNGDWKRTGETVKFNADGNLVDGQQRLMAVQLADIPVWLDITYNVERGAELVMDTGRKRTMRNQIKMRGGDDFNQHVSGLVSWHWRWERGNRLNFTTKRFPQPSLTQLVRQWEKNRYLYENCFRRGTDLWRQSIGAKTPMALGYLLLTEVSEDLGGLFYDEFVSGENLKSGSPVLALRKRLMEKITAHKVAKPSDQLYLVLRAWELWFTKPNSVERINLPAGGVKPDSFPNPFIPNMENRVAAEDEVAAGEDV